MNNPVRKSERAGKVSSHNELDDPFPDEARNTDPASTETLRQKFITRIFRQCADAISYGLTPLIQKVYGLKIQNLKFSTRKPLKRTEYQMYSWIFDGELSLEVEMSTQNLMPRSCTLILKFVEILDSEAIRQNKILLSNTHKKMCEQERRSKNSSKKRKNEKEKDDFSYPPEDIELPMMVVFYQTKALSQLNGCNCCHSWTKNLRAPLSFFQKEFITKDEFEQHLDQDTLRVIYISIPRAMERTGDRDEDLPLQTYQLTLLLNNIQKFKNLFSATDPMPEPLKALAEKIQSCNAFGNLFP